MKALKVWWVLAWDQYYPDSELGNVKSTHVTEEEAKEAAAHPDLRSWDRVEVMNISHMLFQELE